MQLARGRFLTSHRFLVCGQTLGEPLEASGLHITGAALWAGEVKAGRGGTAQGAGAKFLTTLRDRSLR